VGIDSSEKVHRQGLFRDGGKEEKGGRISFYGTVRLEPTAVKVLAGPQFTSKHRTSNGGIGGRRPIKGRTSR